MSLAFTSIQTVDVDGSLTIETSMYVDDGRQLGSADKVNLVPLLEYVDMLTAILNAMVKLTYHHNPNM